MVDVSAPRSRVFGEGTGDGSLAGGLVSVDEDYLAVATQADSPGLGLDDAVFGPGLARAQQSHDGLVDQERAELFHEVQRQAGSLVGGRVRDVEGRFEPCGVERANAFGQEDRVPLGQGGVGQVAGWASAAPVKGDVGGHARGKRVEVGVGARAFDAHDLVEGARACHGQAGPAPRGPIGSRGQGRLGGGQLTQVVGYHVRSRRRLLYKPDILNSDLLVGGLLFFN